MTEAQIKAKELVDKFKPYVNSCLDAPFDFNYSEEIANANARMCALIHVDNVIKELEDNWMNATSSILLLSDWVEIKREIEML